ncbi:GNAT family N-acetyltransferase [Kitasatospora sp. NPDC096147]|uniref:GNAT family N-acetyltransferase n=1 Tax=Kitasatospora sp. NPDC096147 TaxID=3364093 RepID=UPI003811F30D
MTDLQIRPVDAGSDADLRAWQHVHNTIIPTHLLTLDEIRERAARNRLTLAHLGPDLIGCATVRPPTEDTPAATVIARILPPHRRQGHGTTLYRHELAHARRTGAPVIDTVVLATNPDGLHFAHHHGFTETDRYTLPGDTVPYVDLRLTEAT